MNCSKCSNLIPEGKEYNWCEYADDCSYKYCSEDCADITAIEDYTPACPGVYWCSMCRDKYLEDAKGHRWALCNLSSTPDLVTYTGCNDPWAFVMQCETCSMYSFEFCSLTDTKSQYEGQACGSKIRLSKKEEEQARREREYELNKPMKTITIFFGEMGCGKSYCGSRYAQKHGFEFFEGDSVVTPEMADRVSKFQPLTKEMVEEYIGVLSNALADVMLEYENKDRFNFNGLVVSQALYRDEHRRSLTTFLESLGYQVRWRWVRVSKFRNIKNLLTRPNGWQWVYYWAINKPFFQKPTHEYYDFQNIYGE